MKKVDFLIIGGSAAGTTAAEVIRSLLGESSITIITEEDHEFYSRILLPNYIRGDIPKEKIFLKKPEWYQERRIDLIKNVKAMKLNANDHTVACSNGEFYSYSKLLLALGVGPIRLNVSGSNLKNISYLRNLDDAEEIIASVAGAKVAVVVGGGFIGLEYISCLVAKGVGTTILDGSQYYWGNRLDRESSQILQNVIEANGVAVVVGDQVDKFIEKGNGTGTVGGVVSKSGRIFPCDMVGIGIGIKSDLAWLEGSGLKIDQGIVTNEYLETNLGDVYGAGDCANFYDLTIESDHNVGTWANATLQGRVVGMNMAATPLRSVGQSSEGQGRTAFNSVSSYTTTFFGASCSLIGMTDESFADETVSRGSVESGKITRIFIKSIRGTTRIVGASIINNPAEVSSLSGAVRKRSDIAKYVDKLSDLNFDLKNLLQP